MPTREPRKGSMKTMIGECQLNGEDLYAIVTRTRNALRNAGAPQEVIDAYSNSVLRPDVIERSMKVLDEHGVKWAT